MRNAHTLGALVLALAVGQALGQTIVGDLTWPSGSTQTITDDLIIQGTLTIEPGVQVNLDADKLITIQNGGVLVVAGSEVSPAVFTSTARWLGLVFEPGSDGQIDHAVLERIKDAAVVIDSASPSFTNTMVRDVIGAATPGAYGFFATGAADPTIERCKITNIAGATGVSTSNKPTAGDGATGSSGNNGHLNGYTGNPGGDAASADDASVGGEAVAIHLEQGATALIVSNRITDIRGGRGGTGGVGGKGGFGGTGGAGWSYFGAGNGGKGGRGGHAGDGGDGGDGGFAVGIRALNPAGRIDAYQNLIADLTGGNGGNGGDGGEGGNGGYGGWGASTDIPFANGGNGGNGGTGGNPGDGGAAGDAGEAYAFVIDDAATRAFFVHNTVANIRKGTRGTFGIKGYRAPGGAPGGPGTGGFGGSDGSSGSVGTWNFGGTDGAAGLVGDSIGLMAGAPSATIQVAAINNVFSIGSSADAMAYRTGGSAFIVGDANAYADYENLFDGTGTTSLGFMFIVVDTATDPLFVDAGAGDYRLADMCAAIDAGDSFQTPAVLTTDLDGNPRIVDEPSMIDTGVGAGAVVDMGAFEYTAAAPVCVADVTSQNAPVGDPTYGVPDGLVTAADLQFYVNLWVALDPAADLTTPNAGQGDPDYGVPDGTVTAIDLQYFVNAWVAGCP